MRPAEDLLDLVQAPRLNRPACFHFTNALVCRVRNSLDKS